MFCSVAALALSVCHVCYQLKNTYMCNLELAVNSSCTSEIILEMYNRECCLPTVILKQAVKVSVGMVFTGEYYGFL